MEKVHREAVTEADEGISEIETDEVMAVVDVLETEMEAVIVVTEAAVRDLMEVIAEMTGEVIEEEATLEETILEERILGETTVIVDHEVDISGKIEWIWSSIILFIPHFSMLKMFLKFGTNSVYIVILLYNPNKKLKYY